MNENWLPGDPILNEDGSYTVHLCSGCIEALKEHNPYTFAGDKLVIVEVPEEWCDNTLVVKDNKVRQQMKDSNIYPYHKM